MQNLSTLPHSRAEALASGSPKYFTGVPCVNGHIKPRYTTSCACSECHKKHVYAKRGYVPKDNGVMAFPVKDYILDKRYAWLVHAFIKNVNDLIEADRMVAVKLERDRRNTAALRQKIALHQNAAPPFTPHMK